MAINKKKLQELLALINQVSDGELKKKLLEKAKHLEDEIDNHLDVLKKTSIVNEREKRNNILAKTFENKYQT